MHIAYHHRPWKSEGRSICRRKHPIRRQPTHVEIGAFAAPTRKCCALIRRGAVTRRATPTATLSAPHRVSCSLLDVVPVGHAVIVQDVAVVPEPLDNSRGEGATACRYLNYVFREMGSQPEPLDLRPIKDGSAAFGEGWVVHGDT